MDYEPVDVPREVGWRGTANRLVIWLAHRPWTAVGCVALVVAVVASAATGIALGPWADLPPQVGGVVALGAGGVAAGALLFVDALLGRTGRTYRDGITLAAIGVVLPLAVTVSTGIALDAATTGGAFGLKFILVGTPVNAGVAVFLVGGHRLMCAGRAIELESRDWLVLTAWWVALVCGGAFLADALSTRDGFVAAAVAAVSVLPILTRAPARHLWLALPVVLATVYGGSVLMRFLALIDPWTLRSSDVLASLPAWVGFLLGAWPFVFLARRAHRMSVLPPWE